MATAWFLVGESKRGTILLRGALRWFDGEAAGVGQAVPALPFKKLVAGGGGVLVVGA